MKLCTVTCCPEDFTNKCCNDCSKQNDCIDHCSENNNTCDNYKDRK